MYISLIQPLTLSWLFTSSMISNILGILQILSHEIWPAPIWTNCFESLLWLLSPGAPSLPIISHGLKHLFTGSYLLVLVHNFWSSLYSFYGNISSNSFLSNTGYREMFWDFPVWVFIYSSLKVTWKFGWLLYSILEINCYSEFWRQCSEVF